MYKHSSSFGRAVFVCTVGFALITLGSSGCSNRASTVSTPASKKATTATTGYKPLNSASRIVPIGDLALIDLGEEGEVAVMLVENGKIVMDMPAGSERSSGSDHVVSADGNYAAVIYGVEVSRTPPKTVDSFAIVDGRKGTVTRLGGSWAATDTAWRTLTGQPLPLRKTVFGNGGLPPLPAPTVPPKRYDSWSTVK